MRNLNVSFPRGSEPQLDEFISPHLARLSHPLSSRDAARTCSCSRSESNRSEHAEQVDGAKQSQPGRNEVKSSGERRLAESPEGCPRHQRAGRIFRRAVPAERNGHILPKDNSRRNEAGAGPAASRSRTGVRNAGYVLRRFRNSSAQKSFG
jgi:hypothetical protein